MYKYSSKVVPVSIELLQDSMIDVEAFIRSRLATRLARITARHYTVGTGTGQPNGVSTASSVGKVGLTGQTTTVTYDDLVDLEHSVDIAYRGRPDVAFMMNDLSLRNIRKIKDGSGLPIFGRDPGGDGSPIAVDMLFGKYRVEANNYVAAMAANAKSILFGAMKEYVIRDVMELLIRRFDDSAYGLKGQVGFCAWLRTGGNLIDNGGAIKAYQNSAT